MSIACKWWLWTQLNEFFFEKKSYVCYYDIKTQIISLSSIATLSEGDNWNTWKMDNYHQLELVGEGSFGKVYKGRRKFSSQVSK